MKSSPLREELQWNRLDEIEGRDIGDIWQGATSHKEGMNWQDFRISYGNVFWQVKGIWHDSSYRRA